MKHLFSSGEVMYQKNEKSLPEGLLKGIYLEYDSIEPDTRFICSGTLNGIEVKVSFTLSSEDYEGIINRFNFRILMQSDVLLAEWKDYEIQK